MSLPKMSAMWDKYPIDDKSAVANQVGGSILWDFNHDPKYNTCCIRTSLALNYSGAPIAKDVCDNLKNPYVPPKVRASQGKDKMWYIASVYDMRVYLEATYGQPKKFKRMSREDLAALLYRSRDSDVLLPPLRPLGWFPSPLQRQRVEADA